MANFRIKPNRAGIKAEALQSPEVRDAVRAIVDEIATRARSLTDDEILVEEGTGRNRARAAVIRLGSGARGEAEDRALGRSIGGA